MRFIPKIWLFFSGRILERELYSLSGDDPLEPWYLYLKALEDMPGASRRLPAARDKCLGLFRGLTNLKNDKRMLEIYFDQVSQDLKKCFGAEMLKS